MNEKQKRVVRFLGTGAVIGAVIGVIMCLCLPIHSGKAEQVLGMAIFGLLCGAAVQWFTALR
jgi:hypothetical protein